MSRELTTISPEGIEVANAYIIIRNIEGVSKELGISEYKVAEILNTRSVKKYIDAIYFDTGFRNRNNIASLLDEMIASKIEEAQESGIYTNKDLADLLLIAHKMRMDEIKAFAEQEKITNIKNQTNVQINDAGIWGQGNYGKLMETIYGKVLP